jgi:hypothetical protein
MINGKTFAGQAIARIASYDFGVLPVIGIDSKFCNAVNAFEVYKTGLSRNQTG